MQPLYNHGSQDTAYLVDDYPYGRSVRCRIRYWLEHKLGKGWRMCSQTENPFENPFTKIKVWNKPKASTYAALGGCMYLDEIGHVQWRGLSHGVSPSEALAFARDFPDADLSHVRAWSVERVAYLKACVDGRVAWKINGQIRPWSDADHARHQAELLDWTEVARVAGESTSEAFREVSAQLAGVAVDVAREPGS